jgi:hypothetical protein
MVSVVMLSEAQALEGLSISANPFYKPEFALENEVTSNSCAQFAGEWQGSCDGAEGKKEIQMKIAQKECLSLNVDGLNFPIDGMETGASHQGSSMSNESTTLNWDPDRNKIVGNSQSNGQLLGKRKTFKYQFKSKFTMERDKSALVVKTEAFVDTFVNDFKRVEKTDSVCRLEKKSDQTKVK